MEIVTKIAPIVLAIIMFGLGLGLSVKDFTRILRNPGDFFVGFISQLVILPIIALGVALILNLSPPLAVGLMIIAAAPGGVTSNILTKFANGDVALSVSLTAFVSLISIISVPLIVFTSADLLQIKNFSKDISMASISLKMVFVVTIPVIIGMLIRKFASNFVTSRTQIIQRFSIILFVIVFAAIWIEEWENIYSFIARAGVITLTLNIIMMSVGFYIAKIFATGIAQRKCISLESGLQNGTLAVFVSSQIFDDIVYMVPTAAYALIMFITSIIFVFIIRRST